MLDILRDNEFADEMQAIFETKNAPIRFERRG